jgi:excisionase family DNA binding protein
MTATRSPSPDEELLDVRGAAVFVGKHPETVRRWIWSGRLPARRVGQRVLVARTDLENLVENGRFNQTLGEWAAHARLVRSGSVSRSGQTASDLVLEDRALRQRS